MMLFSPSVFTVHVSSCPATRDGNDLVTAQWSRLGEEGAALSDARLLGQGAQR